MNIIWDFRLFSYGYSNRGVGEYTLSLASKFIANENPDNLYVIGDRECMPEPLCHNKINWIQYKSKNWKQDLINIPMIIRKYKGDVFHYWIALGPLYNIGMGLFHPCRTIATIYDLGTENWDVPFLKSVKKSWYWKIQKNLIKSIDNIVSISEATSFEISKTFPSLSDKITVIYRPSFYKNERLSEISREKYFITLGGSPHKNVARVVEAFNLVRQKNADLKLIILGQINKHEEGLECVPENVIFEESMEHYRYHLTHATGLIFCSIYEGLGIPPLEAMSFGCPLLLSNIPSLIETCSGAAVFSDPIDVRKIADNMLELINNSKYWSLQSYNGALEYERKTKDAAKKLNNIYQNFNS